MPRVLLLLCAVLVVGCTNLTGADYKASASNDQMGRDTAACELEAQKAQSSNGAGGIAGVVALNETYNAAFDACMRSKGYERE